MEGTWDWVLSVFVYGFASACFAWVYIMITRINDKLDALEKLLHEISTDIRP